MNVNKLLVLDLRLLLYPLQRFFHSLNDLRMKGRLDALVFSLIEQLKMQVKAALLLGLVFFCRDAVLIGPGVLPNAGDLPRDFYIRGVGFDCEAISFDFLRYNRLGKRPMTVS